MNFSLHSLSISSTSLSPFMTIPKLTVTKSSFVRHFNSIFYNVRNLKCNGVSFAYTLNSAVKVDKEHTDTIYHTEEEVNRRYDLFDSKDTHEFQKCSFFKCRAPINNNGGAICLVTSKFWGDLFISECSFSKCQATVGGAIFVDNYYFVSTRICVTECNAEDLSHYIYSNIKKYDYKSYLNSTTVFDCGTKNIGESIATLHKCKPCLSYDNFTLNKISPSSNSAHVLIKCTANLSCIEYSYWEKNGGGSQLQFIGNGNDILHSAKGVIFNHNLCEYKNCALFVPKDVQFRFSDSYFIGTIGKTFIDKTPTVVEEETIYDSNIELYECYIDKKEAATAPYVKQTSCKYGAKESEIKLYELLNTGVCEARYRGLTQRDIFIISMTIPIIISFIIIITVLALVLKPRWLCFFLYDKDDPAPYCCCTEDCFLCCCCHDDQCCRCCYHEDICYCLSNPCWCDFEAYKRTAVFEIRTGSNKRTEMVEVLTQEEAIKQQIEPPTTTALSLPCTTIKSTMR